MSLIENLINPANEAEYQKVKAKIIDYFKEKDWDLKTLGDGHYEFFYVAQPQLSIEINVNKYYIYTFARVPFFIPTRKIQAVYRFVNIVNYHLLFGHFEMDLFNGAIYYKYGVDYVGEYVDNHYLDNVIMATPSYLIKFIPGFEEISYKNSDPLKTFKKITF